MSNEPTPRTDAIRKRIPEPRAIQDMICLAFDLERELAEATKQRDALAEALSFVLSCGYNGPLPEYARDKAQEALAAVKGENQ